MGTLLGEDLCHFLVLTSLPNGGRLLKERICSSKNKFFLLGRDPILEGLFIQASKEEATQFVSGCESGRKRESVHIHLRTIGVEINIPSAYLNGIATDMFTYPLCSHTPPNVQSRVKSISAKNIFPQTSVQEN